VADELRGPLMGVLDAAVWPSMSIDLPARWALLMYTDGLVEGRAAPDTTDRLGEQGVLEIVRRHHDAGTRGNALLDAVVAEVEKRHGGPLSDDLAVSLVQGAWR
jgi:serine phosphatase RsbU (regulator of sigma subunit)